MPQVDSDDMRLYTGSCHCGAVTLAVKTKSLKDVSVREDNCSICQRNANICIYPTKSQVMIRGEENTTEYCFGRKFNGHRFCKVCGVQMYMKVYGPPKEVFERLPEKVQERLKPQFDIVPIRAAVLDGVDISKLKVERTDEGTDGYSLGD